MDEYYGNFDIVAGFVFTIIEEDFGPLAVLGPIGLVVLIIGLGALIIGFFQNKK
ncbi:MAG: hypothetical protein AABW67_03515 [Nanoarchaeota archaeon]